MLYTKSRELISFLRFFIILREKLYTLISFIQDSKTNKESLKLLFIDILRKSKLEKRKRKTTEQALMEHDLPDAVLQMLA
jgi:hypothetical protein